jgi:LemA protein
MDKTKIFVVFALIGLAGVFIFKVIGLQLAVFIVLAVGGWFIIQYNRLQSLSQQIQESHSNIQISMKKRLDLANKLLEITANYADHESRAHLGVAKLESLPSTVDASANPNEGILGNFMMMSRAYPELQANQTYQILMKQLEDIEKNLQQKREIYNIKVRAYNVKRTTIPMVFLSDQLGFQAAPYFDAITDDAIAGLRDFKTADSAQLKSFLSGLGGQVAEKSGSLSSGIENATKSLLNHPPSAISNGSVPSEPSLGNTEEKTSNV